MKIKFVLLGLAAAGATAVAVTPALAAAGHASGSTETFTISEQNGRQVVVAHGAFVGGGKDVSKGDKDVLHLGNGTLTATHPNKQAHFKYHINPKTCYYTVNGHGRYTLGDGTGAYHGITGHGTYIFRGQGIASRKASGKCKPNAQPQVEIGTITASGPVSGS